MRRRLDKRELTDLFPTIFLLLHIKFYVVGTSNNSLAETILLSTNNIGCKRQISILEHKKCHVSRASRYMRVFTVMDELKWASPLLPEVFTERSKFVFFQQYLSYDSVGNDAGCQSRGCEVESRLGQLSFRRLSTVIATSVICFPPMG